MGQSKDRRAPKRKHAPRRVERPIPIEAGNRESTGQEAAYLKSLIDSRTMIVVVLTSGETLRGHVRYYDRDCFSLGPADGGPKLFLRKSSIRYIYEEDAPREA
jgi:small nuclear ribonucleoprotein (snRNP)-like protein